MHALCLYNEYAVLLLGKPQLCGSTMQLVWQQQISALERIELDDDAVDKGFCVVSISVLLVAV